MILLKRFLQRFAGDDPAEWPHPSELLFAWLAFGLPAMGGTAVMLLFFFTAVSVPVLVEKRLLDVRSDGTYHYYIKLYYETPSGRYEVQRISTVLYTDLERAAPFKALYHPLAPSIGFLQGLRGFWLPGITLVMFFSLFTGGTLWLLRILKGQDD
ncbi:MAG: hypothetical protein N2110_01310 [Flavobacteriales bacterium]|nr:hypothetical protein [Flavobacteriales bacterium]MCX7767648.1 hypothetical protein [Flavobacteriales bacterium]MDW8409510.1 hypothetical protein [Flavobacteriales bacterium]